MFNTNLFSVSGLSKTISSDVQCFTTNGTWSCCPGAFCVEVVAIGAGGGGRCSSPLTLETGFGNREFLGGPGGGAGGVSICTFTSGFGSSQSVVIGTSSPENSGGASCFGTLVCAGGGGVGQASFACCGSSPVPSPISAAGGAGGVGNMGTSPSGGTTRTCLPPNFAYNSGDPGGSASGFPGGGGGGGSTSSTIFVSCRGAGGAGGASSTICGITLGAGGEGGNITRTGVEGSSFGGGGGGGTVWTNGSPRYAGGTGGQGIVKVTQYFIQ